MGVKCGNQMFLDWLTELREDAQAKGLKSAESYGKACKSLAACPVTYERPRDLICLTGLGPKTCEILEKRWRAWCKETGRAIDATPEKRKKVRQPSTSPLLDIPSDLSDADAPGPSRRAPAVPASSQAKPKAKAKPKAPKQYVPQSRSGAYAILLALVLAIDNPLACTQVYMGKSEISRAAQPFSDTSFTASEKGSYYTAWNSMKTLINKGLVYATGNPQRYCLTEEGYDTACAIRALLPEYAHATRYPFLHDSLPTSIARATALSRAASAHVTGPSRLTASAKPAAAAPPSPPISDVFDFDVLRSPSPPLRTLKAPRLSASSTAGGDSKKKPQSSKFQFWYISSLGSRVPTLSEAMIRLDPDEFVNLRKIEFRFLQRDHPFVQQQVRLADKSGDSRVRDDSGAATLMGYVVEEGAPPRCSTFGEGAVNSGDLGGSSGIRAISPKKDSSKKRSSLSNDDGPLHTTSGTFNGTILVHDDFDYSGINMAAFDDDDDFLPIDPAQPTKRARAPITGRKEIGGSSFTFTRTTSAPSGGTGRTATKASDIDLDLLDQSSAISASRRISSKVTTASMSTIEAGPSRARPLSAASKVSPQTGVSDPLDTQYPKSSASAMSKVPPVAEPIGEADPSSIPKFHPSNALIFPPGTYDVILIIDTREIESKSSRDRIAESLLSKGVRVETRALKLGDMMWIARYNDGHGGEEDECVLDYVVERKRLDDLCISIRDGRYTEQCHRLGNSAIRNVYYIVEDFQVAERMEYHGLQIQTAKSQIQVHNRFFLKETHKLSETIDFLCTMTKVIQGILSGKELRVIPTKYLSRSTYKALQERLRVDAAAADAVDSSTSRTKGNGGYLTSFEAYQALNDKSASLTLRDKFARMLMCVKGMSAEKVSSVLDVWDSPRELWDDLKAHDKRCKAEARARAAIASTAEGAEMVDENGQGKGKGKKKKEVIRGKEMFFADRVKGEGRRKIGDALSRELYRSLMGDDE